MHSCVLIALRMNICSARGDALHLAELDFHQDIRVPSFSTSSPSCSPGLSDGGL